LTLQTKPCDRLNQFVVLNAVLVCRLALLVRCNLLKVQQPGRIKCHYLNVTSGNWEGAKMEPLLLKKWLT